MNGGSMPDLREFLRGVEALGELKTVRQADWNLELGAITEISAAEAKPPALLFDDIKPNRAPHWLWGCRQISRESSSFAG